MFFKGTFQPKTFYDSMIPLYMISAEKVIQCFSRTQYFIICKIGVRKNGPWKY